MIKDYCVFCGSAHALVAMGNIQAKNFVCKECIDKLHKAKPGDFLYTARRPKKATDINKGGPQTVNGGSGSSLAETMGARIKKFRLQAGMTQKTFAKKIGVSTNFLGDVERQKKKMSFSKTVEMIHKLNLSPEWLVYFVYGVPMEKDAAFPHPLHLIIDGFDTKVKNQIYAAVVSIKNSGGKPQ